MKESSQIKLNERLEGNASRKAPDPKGESRQVMRNYPDQRNLQKLKRENPKKYAELVALS